MGFRGWGLPALRAAAARHEIVAVVTHPDTYDAFNTAFNESVAEFARSLGVPTFVSTSGMDNEVVAELMRAKPDLIVASNWRRRIDARLLSLAGFGGINVHRSLLPKYAGFAPINWAVASGEKVTGVTIHVIADGLDTGDIVAQESVEIDTEDTATTVFRKMLPVVALLVTQALADIEAGAVRYIAQDIERLEYYPQRTERDLRINWWHPRARVRDLVRAQSTPFPAAFTTWNERRVYIESADLARRCYRGTPGRIAEVNSDGIVVLCGEDQGPGGQGLLVRSARVDDAASGNAATTIRSTREWFN
jgi:methionyl-tRNA formyltransferase